MLLPFITRAGARIAYTSYCVNTVNVYSGLSWVVPKVSTSILTLYPQVLLVTNLGLLVMVDNLWITCGNLGGAGGARVALPCVGSLWHTKKTKFEKKEVPMPIL